MSTSELVALIVSAVSGTFSMMLALIVWLIKHSANAELRLLNKAIEDAQDTAKKAHEKLTEEVELRHKQDLKLTSYEGKLLAFDSDIHRLEEKDNTQEQMLDRLKERLDRGARTNSDQMRAARLPREEQPSESPLPLPPMRPRLPSRRGE